MLFFLYLKEIRYRILYCFISLIYSWLICFIFVEELIYYLTKPLLFIDLGSKEIFNHFIFTNLGDAFFSFFNLSLSIGFCISLYFFIFQFFSHFNCLQKKRLSAPSRSSLRPTRRTSR